MVSKLIRAVQVSFSNQVISDSMPLHSSFSSIDWLNGFFTSFKLAQYTDSEYIYMKWFAESSIAITISVHY